MNEAKVIDPGQTVDRAYLIPMPNIDRAHSWNRIEMVCDGPFERYWPASGWLNSVRIGLIFYLPVVILEAICFDCPTQRGFS